MTSSHRQFDGNPVRRAVRKRTFSRRRLEQLETRAVLTSVSFVTHTVEPSFANGRFESTDLADIDQDGDADIVSVGVLSGIVAWYENIDGVFGPKQIIGEPSREEPFGFARTAAAGDLDGDGDADVVATNGRQAIWYENLDGHGRFGPRRVIDTIESVEDDDRESRDIGDIGLISLSDIDNDGDLDIAAATQRVYWFENDGDASFSRRLIGNINVGNSAFSRPFFAADIDGDRDVDFLTRDGGTLVLIRNAETGFDREAIDLPHQVFSVYIEDMDADGDLDGLVSHSSNDGRVSQASWVENVDGVFGTPRLIYSTNQWTGNAIHAADINGDGENDVVVANAWYENQGMSESFERRTTSGTSGFSSDVDLDGDIDLVTHRTGELIQWHENVDSQGSFVEHTVATQALGTLTLDSADFDGDDDLDIVMVSATLESDLLAWYENLDDGSFGRQQRLSNSWPEDSYFLPKAAQSADLDRDGNVDIIAAGFIGPTRASEVDDSFYGVAWYQNTDGLGSFTPQLIARLGHRTIPVGVATGDFDGDGAIDVLAGTDNGELFFIRQTNTTGRFDPPNLQGEVFVDGTNQYPPPFHVIPTSVGENRDGVLTFEFVDDEIGLLWELDLISSQLQEAKEVPLLSNDHHPNHIADFDGDGDLDAAYFFSDDMLIYFRNENGSLVEDVEIIPSDNHFFGLSHVADVDQDGDPDVVSASGRGVISWHENRLPGDVDNDNDVDFMDFLALASKFGQVDAVWADGDIDVNGKVEFADFLALAANFGATRTFL